jgi:Holliday junction resolvasome RuvABC DNA-binding subunit
MNNFKQGTQKYILYEYLQTGKAITTRTAITVLGIADVQGVIRDLKKEGVDIAIEDVKVPTRYTKSDGSVKFAHVREYSLDLFGFKTAEEYAEWDF